MNYFYELIKYLFEGFFINIMYLEPFFVEVMIYGQTFSGGKM